MRAVGVDTSVRSVVCILCEENIVDKCRWVIGLAVVCDYDMVCSLFVCMDGKELDDLVPFPNRPCIFSPFFKLDFGLHRLMSEVASRN